MGIELKMPALSPTMEEGTLAKWLVKEGDNVVSGDLLAEIETDKATMEFEAVEEGVISKILVAEGTDGVKVGTVIALMGGEGEPSAVSVPAEQPAVEQKAAESEAPVPAKANTGTTQLTPRVAADPDVPAGTAMTSCRSARRCAMRWLRKCGATTGCS